MSGKQGIALHVVFRKSEEGIIAECVEIPGCLSQGDTAAEARTNIVDAINGCLSVMMEDAIKANGFPETPFNFVGIEKQEELEVEAPHVLDPALV